MGRQATRLFFRAESTTVTPEFMEYERVFLFLNPQWSAGEFPVVAGEHGKFSVLRDPVSGRELIANPGATHLKASAVRQVRLATSVPRLDR